MIVSLIAAGLGGITTVDISGLTFDSSENSVFVGVLGIPGSVPINGLTFRDVDLSTDWDFWISDVELGIKGISPMGPPDTLWVTPFPEADYSGSFQSTIDSVCDLSGFAFDLLPGGGIIFETRASGTGVWNSGYVDIYWGSSFVPSPGAFVLGFVGLFLFTRRRT